MPELMIATVVEARETSQGSRYQRYFFLVAALFLLTIGGALRVYHLGNRSLWFDEALTANISRGTLTQVLDKTRRVSAPVMHPYILYLAEKVGRGPIIARAPSVLASLLAIFMMLAMVRAKVSHSAALFSAAILAMSASQIRYAQEVREYSLTVLFATILIYCFLRKESGSPDRHSVWLSAVLFLVPLVQNGMVFFGAAVLSVMALRLWFAGDSRFRLSDVVIGSASLLSGTLLSYALTLRYQLKLGTQPWYLAPYYFDHKTMSVLRFLGTNSKGLLSFFIPGQFVSGVFLIAAVIFCLSQALNRKLDALALLVFASLAIIACAAVLKLYPYGGTRQCLFLAPGLILFAGVVIADLSQRIKKSWQPIVTIGILVLVLFSGYRGMLRQWPYREVEDTLSILRELSRSSAPKDQVWVNHDAVPAFEFYQPQKDPRCFYGIFHADANQYLPELSGFIDQRTDRLWLVFSHLEQSNDRAEEELIVNSLRPHWDVREVMEPENTNLFLALRRTSH